MGESLKIGRHKYSKRDESLKMVKRDHPKDISSSKDRHPKKIPSSKDRHRHPKRKTINSSHSNHKTITQKVLGPKAIRRTAIAWIGLSESDFVTSTDHAGKFVHHAIKGRRISIA